jgi:cytochrome c-type biogenesis protein CcmH/NrfG
MKPTVTQEAKVEPKPEEAPAPVPAKTAEAKLAPAPTASAEVAKAEPDAKAADEPKKAEPSGGDVKALTKEAEAFLNRGNRKDAMLKAREAIAADPSEAMPYLLLGSALQDSGKWKDGIEAYSECVRNATKGPVGECRQMGGHK